MTEHLSLNKVREIHAKFFCDANSRHYSKLILVRTSMVLLDADIFVIRISLSGLWKSELYSPSLYRSSE